MLTIGEGLVAQIPALIISTAAGIIVTRVASEDEGGHLGRDIGLQVLAHPRAIAIAAGLLALLAIVPGLPALPFLVLALVLGGIAWRLVKVAGDRRRGSGTAQAPAAAPLDAGADAHRRRGLGRAGPARWGPFRATSIPRLRERLFAELGLPLPAVRLRPGAAGRSRRQLRDPAERGPDGARRDRPRRLGSRARAARQTRCWR